MKAYRKNSNENFDYTYELCHMTKMPAMHIYVKTYTDMSKKSSSPEPMDRWPWNMVWSIKYPSATKIIQTITLV